MRARPGKKARAASARRKAVDDQELILRVDADGLHPHTADPGVVLAIAHSYYEALRAAAKGSDHELIMRGISIRDECVAIAYGVADLKVAEAVAAEVQRGLQAGAAATQGPIARLRASLRELPPGSEATFKVGRKAAAPLRWDDLGPQPAPVGELLSLRATPIRVGGVSPAVRFDAGAEPAAFTLACSEDMSRELGALLYREIDLEARITRDQAGRITAGTVLAYREVTTTENAFEAWRAWFKVNGAGWDEDSVEAFLERHGD